MKGNTMTSHSENPSKTRMVYAQAYRYARRSGATRPHALTSFLMYCADRAEVERTIQQLDRTRPELWT